MSFFSRIDSVADRSALVRGALSVARRVHAEQVRETGNGEIAFIEHPLAVAGRLAMEDYPDEVLAAALLHDTIEYAGADPGALRRRFGATVADLVELLSEDMLIEDYEERKEEYRDRIGTAGTEAQAIFAADRTANVAVLRDAYADRGEYVDSCLPVSLDLKILVWEYDLEMLFERSPGTPLVDRFADEMVELWSDRAAEERAFLC